MPEQRRAAHKIQLFHQNNMRAGLSRVDCCRHTGSAGANAHYIAGSILMLCDLAGNGGLEVVQIRARLLQALRDSVQNAPAGHRRTAVNVDGDALVGYNILRQLFKRGHADASRFGLTDNVYLLDFG